MLEGYLRSREVLKRLVLEPEFDRLYDASRLANREKRDTEFVQVINDDTFHSEVEQVHDIMRLIRRYLRVWDAEKSQVSEVVPATILLEHRLLHLKETTFLNPSKKREVLRVLEKRCKGAIAGEGGTMQIRILQDVHFTAWLLDPNLCPVDVTEHLPAFERHLNVYLSGAKNEMNDASRREWAKEIVRRYRTVHQMWGTLRRGHKNSQVMKSFEGFAARYWEDNTPAQTISDGDNDPVAIDLECFAVNTLSLCPSSCATERSFSHQGRIHTKQRNRLAPEVVRNLLFCKWNSRVIRNLDRIQSFDMSRDGPKIKLGSLYPYEDFFNKPMFSSIFSDDEARNVLARIHGKESRIQEEIEASRENLYRDSVVYIFAKTRGESHVARGLPVPVLSLSAQASVHDRSTTLLAEVSAMPDSPTVREVPRQFRANTREGLIQPLSASKRKAAAKRRSAPEALRTPDIVPAEADIGSGSARNENDLRDEDNITISFLTARQLLGGQVSHPPPNFGDQVRNHPGFPSAQGSRAYVQDPSIVPRSTGQPAYEPPHLLAQSTYAPSDRTVQQPSYLPAYLTDQPTYVPSHQQNMPIQGAVPQRQRTGVAGHYPQYSSSQRGSLPRLRGRGRASMSYVRQAYPDGARNYDLQQPHEVDQPIVDDGADKEDDEVDS